VTAAAIARALHGKPCADGFLVRCPVPSHGQGRGDRSPSLSISDGDKPGRLLVRCYAGCDPRDILAELRRRGLIDAPKDGDRRREDRPAHATEPRHERDASALAIWHGSKPAASDPTIKSYLLARGITNEAPPSLRFDTIPYLDRYALPAMIAAVQAPDRRVIAVQTTLIDPRGDRKAQVRLPRKTTGALGWGATRLAAATDRLGLAEGAEKALAAMQLHGVPCWSSLGAQRMHRVWVPDDVRELHIFPDNDDPGRAAAERTAHAHRHRRVVIHFPPEGMKDWDDVTTAQTRTAAA
jgi:putative DNA primase/helicase